MTAAYGSTDVPVSKSQEELRGLLRKFGAQQFTFGEGVDWAGVEFAHADVLVRVRCPVRTLTEDDFRRRAGELKRSVAEITGRGQEQEHRRVWRVLVWTVKARLVAVDEGLETFEQSFLAHIVDPGTNRTVWEAMRELVDGGAFRLGGKGLPALGRGST